MIIYFLIVGIILMLGGWILFYADGPNPQETVRDEPEDSP